MGQMCVIFIGLGFDVALDIISLVIGMYVED